MTACDKYRAVKGQFNVAGLMFREVEEGPTPTLYVKPGSVESHGWPLSEPHSSA